MAKKKEIPDATTTDKPLEEGTAHERAQLVAALFDRIQEGPDERSLDGISDADRFLDILEPSYDFIADAWPFGYVHELTAQVFVDALKHNPNAQGIHKKSPKPILAFLPKRFGFFSHQRVQVRKTFDIAFKAMIALHIATGEEIVQKHFGWISHRHFASIHVILKANPFVKNWIEPSDEALEKLALPMKKNRHVFLGEANDGINEAESIQQNDPDLEKRAAQLQNEAADARLRASLSYATHIERAVEVMLQNLFTLSRSGMLAPSVNKDISMRAQWEILLKTTDVEQDVLRPEERRKPGAQYLIKSWLPSFEEVFTAGEAERVDLIVRRASQQVTRVFDSATRCYLLRRKETAVTTPTDADTAAETAPPPSSSPPQVRSISSKKSKASSLAQLPASEVDDFDSEERFGEVEGYNSNIAIKPDDSEAVSAAADVMQSNIQMPAVSMIDTISSRAGGRLWHDQVGVKLESILKNLDVPSDKGYAIDVKLLPSVLQRRHEQDFDLHSLDDNPAGLDGNLTADECLRLLSFMVAHSSSLDSTMIPVKQRDVGLRPSDIARQQHANLGSISSLIDT